MRVSIFATLALVSGVFAGNCGPANGNAKCASNECCSQYGWCGTTVREALREIQNKKTNEVGRSLRCCHLPQGLLWLQLLLQASYPNDPQDQRHKASHITRYHLPYCRSRNRCLRSRSRRCDMPRSRCKWVLLPLLLSCWPLRSQGKLDIGHYNICMRTKRNRTTSRTRTYTAVMDARPASENAITRRRLLSQPPPRVFPARERHVVPSLTRSVETDCAVPEATSVEAERISAERPTGARASGESAPKSLYEKSK